MTHECIPGSLQYPCYVTGIFEQGKTHRTSRSTPTEHFAARIWLRLAIKTPLIDRSIIPIENGASASSWGIEWNTDGGYVSAIVTANVYYKIGGNDALTGYPTFYLLQQQEHSLLGLQTIGWPGHFRLLQLHRVMLGMNFMRNRPSSPPMIT